jgi:sigma-54 dependent transcriptional regulator, acetoin dehydrogenase operon transcriptional activator AcoR
MTLPNTSFFDSHAARVQWARSRFFDEGQLPTGAVSAPVFESWSRCLRLRQRPGDRAVFEPVTTSRAQLTLQKNRLLLHAWLDELPKLETILGSTSCAAMLTDATGVIVASCCVGRAHESLMPVATRLGVNLSEEAVGTNAPGLVARTGKATSVLAAEHFFDSVAGMHCAAAPIRNVHGQVAGVLDISSEGSPFSFDAAAVVRLYATAIENRLLLAQSNDHLVVRLQVSGDLLNSALVGLVGVDASGRVAWHNEIALSLLGPLVQPEHARRSAGVESALGVGLAGLAALPSMGARPLYLPNGLLVWARAEMRSPDGRRNFVAASSGLPMGTVDMEAPARAVHLSTPALEQPLEGTGAGQRDLASFTARQPDPNRSAASTLRESDRELVERVLAEHCGNVSATAKALGVSRGLIYRRLRLSAAEAGTQEQMQPHGSLQSSRPRAA